MRFKHQINPPVFITSGLLLLSLLGLVIASPDDAARIFGTLLAMVSTYGGWFYVGAIAGFIIFTVWLLFSPYAKLRLGADDERPAFSRLTWFAMLFSAGMGIGLVFYGVAEPIMHYSTLPGVGPRSSEAAARVVPVTIYHWGLHAWVTYVLMGLGIAYFSYRRGLPLAIRSCFHPLLGDRIYGWPGHVIDILAVFGTPLCQDSCRVN
jgi:choline/glycine/proline betaine transport protein